MRMKQSIGIFYKVFALSAGLTLALASAAFADQVTNRLDTSPDAALENLTLSEGATQSVAFRVVAAGGDGEGGCNVDAGEQLVVAVSSSNTSVATVSPQTLTFTACNQDQSTTVTAGARGTATITIAEQSNTTGSGTYDYAPANFSVTTSNVAPTISNIADQTTNEDTPTADIPFTVGDAGTPAANLTVTGTSSNTTLVPNSSITFGGTGANRTLKVTPAADRFGTATISVTVSDGATSATDTFVLTVNAVNDAPSFTRGANQSVREDAGAQSVSNWATGISAGPADESGQSVSFDVTNDNNALFAAQPALSSGGTLTYTPAENASGTSNVEVVARDTGGTQRGGDDTSAPQSFTITVNGVNDAPTAEARSVATSEDTARTITLSGTDIDGDALTFQIAGNPANGTLGAIGAVTCMETVPKTCQADVTYGPSADYNGPDSFKFRADDGTVNSADATVSITIDPVNDRPEIDLNGGSSGRDYSATFVEDGGPAPIVDSGALTVTDVDDADIESATVTFAARPNGDDESLDADVGTTGIAKSYDPATGELRLSGAASRADYQRVLRTVQYDNAAEDPDTTDRSVAFVVSDGTEDSRSATSTINVEATNDAPSITSVTNDGPVDEGSSAMIAVTATDPDASNGALRYAFDCDGDNAFEVGPQSENTAACSFQDDGTRTVNVRVADGDGGEDVGSTTVTFNNVAPTVNAPADQGSNESEEKSFALGSFVDPGADGPWSVSVAWGDGSSDATFTADSPGTLGERSHAYGDNGAYTVTVTVAERGTGAPPSDSAAFRVDTANVAPSATFDAPESVSEGNDIALSLTGPSDPSSVDAQAGFRYAFRCGDAGYGDFGTSNSATCAAGDDGTIAVGGKIRDKDGGEREYEETVAVNNTPPTIRAVSNSGPVDEGSVATITVDAADPVDDALSYAFDCNGDGDYGDAGDVVPQPGNTAECSSTVRGNHTVNVRVGDGDGGETTGSTEVRVNNVPPTISNIPDQIADEDTPTGEVPFSVGDAGTPAGDLEVRGASSNTTLVPNSGISFGGSGANRTVKITPAADRFGTAEITVEVNDRAAIATDTFVLTVNPVNDAPTVALRGDGTVNEGEADTYDFTVSDPDPGDVFAVKGSFPDCGTGGDLVEGSLVTTSGGGRFGCRFPDGPADPAVRIQVTDSRGADSNVDVQGVTVANVAPSIRLSGAANADEGETKTYSYAVIDPGNDSHTIDTRCGANGTKADGSDTYDPAAGSGSFRCRFPDGPATTRVTATVTDSDGASDTDNQFVDVDVANVAPTVELDGPATADEGDTETYAYTVTDPGDDPDPTVRESCGANGTWIDTPETDSFRCTFPDGPANSTAGVSAVDADNDSGSDEISVQINNVAPTVRLTGPATVDEGRTETYAYAVTDPGDDPSPVLTERCGANATYVDTPPADSFHCAFARGPASSRVSVEANDGNDTGEDNIVVQINNVPPTISNIPDQTTNENTPTGALPFTVGDAGTPAGDLEVRGASSNTTLVPDSGISFGGAGANRTVRVTPAADQSGTAEITVEVSDGDAEATEAFVLTVNAVDREAPTVRTFFPTGKKVSPKTRVTATFSEPMDVSTLRDQDGESTTFVLTRKGVQVPATVHYDEASDTAILTPSIKLKRRATYVATVKTGAEDLAGNALANEKMWSFRVRR